MTVDCNRIFVLGVKCLINVEWIEERLPFNTVYIAMLSSMVQTQRKHLHINIYFSFQQMDEKLLPIVESFCCYMKII